MINRWIRNIIIFCLLFLSCECYANDDLLVFIDGPVFAVKDDIQDVFAYAPEGGIIDWDWTSLDEELVFDEDQYDYDDYSLGRFYSPSAGIWTLRVNANNGESNGTDTELFYVCEVEAIVDNDYSSATQYVPLNGSISLYADSNPSTGTPYVDDRYYFPSGSPTWTITTKPEGAENPNLSTWTTTKCTGGGTDAVTLNEFSAPGTYILHAQAGANDDGADITVVVFSATLSWTAGWAIDGLMNIPIDLNVNPSSVKAYITNVDFDIEPTSTSYGNLEVGNALSAILQRDADITHWKVNKAIWYDDTDGDEYPEDCPSSDVYYEISAEFTLGGQTYYPSSTAALRVWSCYCPPESEFCCGESGPDSFWTGSPQINTQQISANHWHATVEQGSFRRSVQASYEVFNPVNSQFYDMIEAEEAYHVEQYEDTDGSSTNGYYVDLWDPLLVMGNVDYYEPFEGSTQEQAAVNALNCFLDAVEYEMEQCDEIMDSPDFYCDVEAEAKSEAGSEYGLAFECAYGEECN